MKHYLNDASEVIKSVGSNNDGLSTAEATERLSKNGKNKLIEAKKESMIRRFFKQLCEPMTIILLVAAVISAGVEIYEGIHSGHMGFPSDVVIILAVVPVPDNLCFFKISRFSIHQSNMSCFFPSCAISAILFCFFIVIFK